VTVLDFDAFRRAYGLPQPTRKDEAAHDYLLPHHHMQDAETADRPISAEDDDRLPPFTSLLIWAVLAIVSWGLIAIAIRLL